MTAERRSPNELVDDDPHASKIAPDDPRLSIPRPRPRVLKMGPVIGVVTLLAALGAGAVLMSTGKSKKVAVTQEPAKVPERPPSVPAFLQEIPDVPAPRPAPAAEKAAAETSRPLPPPVRYFDAPRPDPREQQERIRQQQLNEEARTSELFFASAQRSAGALSAPGASNPSPAMQPPVVPGGLAAPGMPTSPGQNPAEAWDPNLQMRKNAFLDDPRLHPDYLPTTLQAPLSPYELKASAIIPATLITGINSDLPGPVIAQVREQVYDTVTGQHVLIPQGARLLASYDSMVAWGQERVLLCWNRIIFPNGSSINLHCMPAADLIGQAGLTDEVDEHWDRLIAAVGLSTVLSLGSQVVAGDPTGYQPNLAQRAASNAAQQFNSAGQAIVQRGLNIQPTITVRPGFAVNVIVTKDMVLEPYVD